MKTFEFSIEVDSDFVEELHKLIYDSPFEGWVETHDPPYERIKVALFYQKAP